VVLKAAQNSFSRRKSQREKAKPSKPESQIPNPFRSHAREPSSPDTRHVNHRCAVHEVYSVHPVHLDTGSLLRSKFTLAPALAPVHRPRQTLLQDAVTPIPMANASPPNNWPCPFFHSTHTRITLSSPRHAAPAQRKTRSRPTRPRPPRRKLRRATGDKGRLFPRLSGKAQLQPLVMPQNRSRACLSQLAPWRELSEGL